MFTALSNEAPLTNINSNFESMWERNPPKSQGFIRTKADRIVVGITMGDPSGIGPEVIVKAVNAPRINKLAKIVIIGDKFVLSKIRQFTSVLKNCRIIDLKNVPQKNFSFGKISRVYGKTSLEYLDCALSLIKLRKINCLVTAPISKQAINLAGYNYSGHTEYLKAKTKSKKIGMIFVADKLKVTLVTRHMSLKEAIRQLNPKMIVEAISLTHDFLREDFRIKAPRIGVCALNPHSGEHGLLGREEIEIILPAINKAKARYKNIFGPVASDIIFLEALKDKYDAVIAMYHDQALIPIKTLFLSKAVNVTLGLCFVRTSPSHGTAFDISGKNLADPASMIEAIKLAYKLTRNIKK